MAAALEAFIREHEYWRRAGYRHRRRSRLDDYWRRAGYRHGGTRRSLGAVHTPGRSVGRWGGSVRAIMTRAWSRPSRLRAIITKTLNRPFFAASIIR
jgi:hypothetical protein